MLVFTQQRPVNICCISIIRIAKRKKPEEFKIEKLKTQIADRLIFRVPGVRTLRLSLKVPKPGNPFSSTLMLVSGFAALIILGMVLLMLPVSSSSGQFTSPLNALFTATSAVCVTGLTVVETGVYWSTFGQVVLLALFQIGGLGFITGATVLLMAFTGRFGLRERLVVTESMGLERLGGLLGVVAKVALFSLIIEAAGAAVFYFHWLAAGDKSASLWTAIFHAVSAFNNCGMDIFGKGNSMAAFSGDALLLLVTALLVVLGSTGYVVIANMIAKRRFIKFSLDTKIVLVLTLALLVLGTLFFLGAEFSNPATLGPLSFPRKLLVAFFQAVVPRTAGFTAVDIAGLKQITLFFVLLLMFIGGAAGSTAGGLKVNTFGVLLMTVAGTLQGKSKIEAFGRQLTVETVYRAFTLFVFYLGVAGLVILALSITEVFPIDKIFFETVSALSTVGLSAGITPGLSIAGRLVIVFAMFIGRLGPLVLMATLSRRRPGADLEYPHETIRLG
jgi:trk system potassium uptake protein